MKSLIIISILSGIITASCTGQRIKANKVPSIVVNTLKAAYPTATDVEWKKAGNQYEAAVDLTGTSDRTLRIDASGKTVMTKEEMPATGLLPAIATLIREKYTGYSIDDVEKVQKDGLVFYQVDLDSPRKKDLKLVFASDGAATAAFPYWD